jgi:hypothetical protein
MSVTLPKRLDAGTAERLLADLVPSSRLVTLRLDRLHRLEFMAEPRLLGLMARCRRAGEPAELVTKFDIDMERGTAKRLVELFADTVGGVVLAQMSSRIIDGAGSDRRPSIVREQRDRAPANDGFFNFGAERAAPIVDVFGGPAPATMVADSVGSEFEALFREWVDGMNLPALDRGEQESKLTSLIDFAYETFDNTRRHGVHELDRRPIEGVRFVLLRSVQLNAELASATAERVGDGPLARYLRCLGGTLPRSTRILELTVADCGVGIAAALSGDPAAYDGPWEVEVETIESAFVKHRRTPGRGTGGQGLWKALRAVSELHGFVAVRTGRTQLSRDFLAGETLEDHWTRARLTLLPGTSVSLLFPWCENAARSRSA